MGLELFTGHSGLVVRTAKVRRREEISNSIVNTQRSNGCDQDWCPSFGSFSPPNRKENQTDENPLDSSLSTLAAKTQLEIEKLGSSEFIDRDLVFKLHVRQYTVWPGQRYRRTSAHVILTFRNRRCEL